MIHHTHIICHYNEIGIKGGNRDYFEKMLVDNIKNKLDRDISNGFEHARPRTNSKIIKSSKINSRNSLDYKHSKVTANIGVGVKRISGRIIIRLTNKEQMKSKFELILKNIFGIANFSFAIESKQDIKILQEDCWNLIKNEKFKTFRVTTQRSEKNYPLTSQQVNEKVGDYICKKLEKDVRPVKFARSGAKQFNRVNLKNPDINCFIEIVDKQAFIYLEKIDGPGGMPVGTSGKALVLLSGGIDSPVAAYYMLKRGVRTDFIHFHSTSPASVGKVKELAKIINKFQLNSKIFIIPFTEIQKEIMAQTPPKLRVIFYRRVMLKIAEAIANKEKYLVLVTGEAVGQVASQTLENIAVIEDAVHPHTNLVNKSLLNKKTTTDKNNRIGVGVYIPVLRPLIGFDKEEIINKAKEIGTYETSILPHEDCCTRFIPKHPETRAKLTEVKEAEKNLNVEKLVKEAIKNYNSEKL
ncbi:putative tRNA sulfurtransferase [bacterium BMS3Abin15]|nr:putative tRNA sulfurtransferase [bacterium BMS3Abin15]